MDTAIEKLLNPDTPAAEKDAIKASLTPEQQVEFAAAAKKDFEDSLAKASGARQEKNRIDNLIAQKNEELGSVNKTMEAFRAENVDKAISRVASEFKLDEAGLQAVREEFKKLDSGKVDADNIYTDVLKAFVATNPQTFVEAKKSQEQMQAAAAAAAEREARAASGEVIPAEKPQFTPEVMALATANNISPEEAADIAAGNMKRILE